MRVPALCLLFSLCDVMTLAFHGVPAIAHAIPHFAAPSGRPAVDLVVEAARLLFVVSLVPSTLGLAKGLLRGAAWSWLQLPLRLAFAGLGETQYLSFGAIRHAAPLFPPTAEWAYGLLIGAIALDILRPPLARAHRSSDTVRG